MDGDNNGNDTAQPTPADAKKGTDAYEKAKEANQPSPSGTEVDVEA